jgi:hypothetical protein
MDVSLINVVSINDINGGKICFHVWVSLALYFLALG